MATGRGVVVGPYHSSSCLSFPAIRKPELAERPRRGSCWTAGRRRPPAASASGPPRPPPLLTLQRHCFPKRNEYAQTQAPPPPNLPKSWCTMRALFAQVNTYLPCVVFACDQRHVRSLSPRECRNLLLCSPPCLFLDLAGRALFTGVLGGRAVRARVKRSTSTQLHMAPWR